MHKDFHLYGTYLAARIAGFKHLDASKIASAAQAVDDFSYESEYKSVQSDKPKKMFLDAMGYRKDDPDYYKKDNSCPERYLVRSLWTCFHFLPGQIDAPDMELGSEKLRAESKYITRPGGKLYDYLKTMLLSYRGNIPIVSEERDDVLARIGVALHVLADTYAHEGFCGMDSQLNIARNIKVTDINEDLGVIIASTRHVPVILAKGLDFASIGHGTAGHIPDISWITYDIEYKNQSERNTIRKENPEIFANAFVEITCILRHICDENYENYEDYKQLKFEYLKNTIKTSIEVMGANIKNEKIFNFSMLKEKNDTAFRDMINSNLFELNMQCESDFVKRIYEQYLKNIEEDFKNPLNKQKSEFEKMEENSFTNALMWHRSNIMEIIFEHSPEFPERV